MNILVLGGTGAMGTHLVEILRQEGKEVFVTSRHNHPFRRNVIYMRGDAHNKYFLKEVLARQRWDAIVDFMVYTTAEFQHRMPQLLAATAQYIFLSSSRVYADSTEPITEDTPRLLDVSTNAAYLKTDEYALTKARQENALRADCKAGNWTIVRPYITYSENRLQLGILSTGSWLSQALCGQTIVFSKDIADRMTTLTYGYDVARGIAALIGKEKALGETFHITCDRPIRWSEVLNIYLDVLESKTGRRPNVLQLQKSPIMTPQVIYDRYYNRVFDNSKIGRFIDTETFTSPHIGLRQCLESFLENYPSGGKIEVKRTALFNRITGERTQLSEFNGITEKAGYFFLRYCPTLTETIERIYHKFNH